MAHVGQALTFSIVFTNSSGVETDPTTVRFFLRESVDGVEQQWLYDAAPSQGAHFPVGATAMETSGTGNYSVTWVTRKPERHVGFWHGAGNDVDQTSQTTYLVRHSDVESVDGV
jgi:hypothetical protein